MSCTTCDDKITGFFTKAKELNACLGYNLTQAICVGNKPKAICAERDLENIRSMSWLLSKHQAGLEEMCLCGGADSNVRFVSEEFVNNTLDVNGPPTTNVELWKGVLLNSKSNELISVSSRALDVYDPACEAIFGTENALCRLNPTTHKSLRFWSWDDNVPTLLFDTGEIFDGIQEFELVSFYYSELHDSYYLKVNSDAGAITGPILIRVSSDFTSVNVVGLNGVNVPTAANPDPVLMEIADGLNYIFIKRDADNLDVYSLADMTFVKTIVTTGFPYQKMTWDSCECNLILTGGGDNGNAVVHVVDHITGVVTNKYNTALFKNNTSIIKNDGKLLVLTRDESTFTMVLEEWNTCDNMTMVNSVNTGILMGAGVPEFATIHSLIEDEEGNLYITYIPSGGTASLAVFDKDFNLKFTRSLGWGPFGSNLPNSWTNSNINFTSTNLIVHEINQNGVGGTVSYYLDYDLDSLENPRPKCISLTDEEICDMVEKINRITC